MDDLSGQKIRGYELQELVGAGGFGAVYRAVQPAVQRQVAVKVILPRYARHPEFISRFESEAQLIARLEHPHIVPLYDYWHEDGAAYLVMRWMNGGSLYDALVKDGAWPAERVARLLEQIAAALARAHRQNVIHRDIKPANILLDDDGNAYLSDFGIAKDLARDERVTAEDIIVGSPAYLAPEQTQDQPLSPQSDIYSLGIVLYELLRGEHPFPDASTVTMMVKHRSEAVPTLEQLPLGLALDVVIQQATAKDPQARYMTALDLAAAFRQAVEASSKDQTHRKTVNLTLPTARVTPIMTGDLKARFYQKAGAILDRPRRLFGRNQLQQRVLDLLTDHDRVLLHGFGGMGKTALAATVAAEWIDKGNGPVLWLEVGNKDSYAVFEALARAFDAQDAVAGKMGDDQIVALREVLLEHEGLLVLDNVWNEQALFQMMRALPPEMPLLATSRAVMPLDGMLIDVDALGPEEALALLAYHARQEFGDDQDAAKLCETLGYHPFAIEIAGKRLKVDRHLTPARFLQSIAAAPHHLEIPGDFAKSGRRGIRDLLDESVNELEPTERQTFVKLGGLFGPVASMELAALLLEQSVEQSQSWLERLQRRGLLELIAQDNTTPAHYRLHDLTYSYAHALFNAEQETYEHSIATIHRFIEHHTNAYDLLDFEQNNILAAAKMAQQTGKAGMLINIMRLLTLEGFFNVRGHTPLFLERLDEAIAAARADDSVDQAMLHHLLTKRGHAYAHRGDLKGALDAYQAALKLAPNPSREAMLTSTIGITLFRTGQDGSDDYLQRAYDIAKQHQDDVALSFVLGHRGTHAGLQGNHTAALTYLTEAVEVAERLDSPSRYFTSLLNLGSTQESMGQLDAALATHQRAKKLAEEQGNHLWVAYALHAIGEDYHALKQHDNARENLTAALQRYRQFGAVAKAEEVLRFLEKENYIVALE
ncbi:MAG: protein kinase [Chloroflexi bacterium]|nr:protein kinase [Chloroflexota bacterium]